MSGRHKGGTKEFGELDFAEQAKSITAMINNLQVYATARQLNAIPALGETVLVAVTGYGNSADRQRSEESGFDAHGLPIACDSFHQTAKILQRQAALKVVHDIFGANPDCNLKRRQGKFIPVLKQRADAQKVVGITRFRMVLQGLVEYGLRFAKSGLAQQGLRLLQLSRKAWF